MRHALTYFANASCQYTFGDVRILCDPWLSDTAFYGSWYHDPPIDVWPREPDLIYISHIHPDHYDPETLRKFPGVPFLILDSTPNFLEKAIRRDGLKNEIIKAPDGDTITFKGVDLTVLGPFQGCPFHETEVGFAIDSALVVECEDTVIINTNDNTPDLAAARKLKERWPKITVAQLNYNAAGPYPVCFDLDDEEKRHAGAKILRRNLDHMCEVARILKPRFMMPFAGEFASRHNEDLLGISTNNDAARYFDGRNICPATIDTLVLKRGETFEFNWRGERPSFRPTYLSYPITTSPKRLKEAQEKFKAACVRYAYKPDWTVTINDFEVCKGTKTLRCTLDERLLSMILDRKAHWNNAEIGFHIQFHREPDVYDPDLHMLLSFFHCFT